MLVPARFRQSIGDGRKETDTEQHEAPGGRDDQRTPGTFQDPGHGLGNEFWSGQRAFHLGRQGGADVAGFDQRDGNVLGPQFAP